jgi:hypothetical protein
VPLPRRGSGNLYALLMILLGMFGAVAAVILFGARAVRDSDAWLQLMQRRGELRGAYEVFGGAYIGRWYLSAPLVRIVLTPNELLVMARWRWLPLPPTRVPRSQVEHARAKRLVTGYTRLDVGRNDTPSERVRVFLPARAIEAAGALGWVG